MNILCDFHHSDLWWSTYMILEKGLGHRLFRPRGMEWHEAGYYFPGSPDVARQFLVHSMYQFDFALEKFHAAQARLSAEMDDTLWVGMDTINGCPSYPLFRTLTLDEFKDAKIDVILASTADHQAPFLDLRDKYQPKARLLREAGNPGELHSLHPAYENLLTSDVESFERAPARNRVLYHQRFDPRIFSHATPPSASAIGCFMPTFRLEGHGLLERHMAHLPGFRAIDYGVQSPHGYLSTKGALARAMADVSFVWQVKPRGDGFGHVIHNAFAMGRPPIVVEAHYEGRLASRLMRDMETCVLIGDDVKQNADKILAASRSINAMSKAASDAFATIDFPTELESIRNMMGALA